MIARGEEAVGRTLVARRRRTVRCGGPGDARARTRTPMAGRRAGPANPAGGAGRRGRQARPAGARRCGRRPVFRAARGQRGSTAAYEVGRRGDGGGRGVRPGGPRGHASAVTRARGPAVATCGEAAAAESCDGSREGWQPSLDRERLRRLARRKRTSAAPRRRAWRGAESHAPGAAEGRRKVRVRERNSELGHW